MLPRNAKAIVGVIFVDGEDSGAPSAGKVYEYYLPKFIKGYVQPGNHLLVTGGDNKLAVVRVDSVRTDTPTRATKYVVGVADLSEMLAHKAATERRRQLLGALGEMEERRLERQRYADMAAANPEAKKLLDELVQLDALY